MTYTSDRTLLQGSQRGFPASSFPGWQLTGIAQSPDRIPAHRHGLCAADGSLSDESFTDRANMVAGQSLNLGISSLRDAPLLFQYCCLHCHRNDDRPRKRSTRKHYWPRILLVGSFASQEFPPAHGKHGTIRFSSMRSTHSTASIMQNPSTTVTSSSFAQVTASQPPRQLQLGAKFTF